MRTMTILAALAAATVGSIHAAPPTTAPSSTTQPAGAKVETLIKQLAADSPRQRDAATDALRKLGKEALPALQAAMNDDDAQIRASAESLIADLRDKDNPKPQVAGSGVSDFNQNIFIQPGGGIVINGIRGQNFQGQMRVHAVAGGANVQHVAEMSINENGHKIHIHEDNDGVKVEVTDNGETKTYEAKTPAELKEKQPEGYKVYEKYMNNKGAAGQLKIEVAPK